MSFEVSSGMLVFNVVVISVNIRIYMISNQISPALLIASILSVCSYYLIFFFVEIILYSDCKNVLNHQLSSLVFWALVNLPLFSYSFKFLHLKPSLGVSLKLLIKVLSSRPEKLNMSSLKREQYKYRKRRVRKRKFSISHLKK